MFPFSAHVHVCLYKGEKKSKILIKANHYMKNKIEPLQILNFACVS